MNPKWEPLILILGTLLLCAIGVAIIALPPPWSQLLTFVFGFTVLLAVCASISIWLFGQSKLGLVLLDLGRHGWGYVLFGALCLAFAGYLLVWETHTGDRWFIPTGFLLLALGLRHTAFGLSKIQIREKGWSSFWRPVRWEQVESYKWEPNTGGKRDWLQIRLRPGFSWDLFPSQKEMTFKVRKDQRSMVDILLSRYIKGEQ